MLVKNEYELHQFKWLDMWVKLLEASFLRQLGRVRRVRVPLIFPLQNLQLRWSGEDGSGLAQSQVGGGRSGSACALALALVFSPKTTEKGAGAGDLARECSTAWQV